VRTFTGSFGHLAIAGEKLQNLGLCSALLNFEEGVINSYEFSGLILRIPPLFIVACNYKQGVLKTYSNPDPRVMKKYIDKV
jgi:hypothetical protein